MFRTKFSKSLQADVQRGQEEPGNDTKDKELERSERTNDGAPPTKRRRIQSSSCYGVKFPAGAHMYDKLLAEGLAEVRFGEIGKLSQPPGTKLKQNARATLNLAVAGSARLNDCENQVKNVVEERQRTKLAQLEFGRAEVANGDDEGKFGVALNIRRMPLVHTHSSTSWLRAHQQKSQCER